MMNQNFYMNKWVETDFDTTIEKLKSALADQGFGIVSEINMQEKLKTGAGKQMNKYMILGACNPHGAYRALQIEERIGVLLPCNFIVRETEGGKVEVSPPIALMFGAKADRPLSMGSLEVPQNEDRNM